MKRKILIPILTTTIFNSCLLPLSGCNKNSEIGEDAKIAIEEFAGNENEIKGIVSIPRPSGHCEQIAQYIKSRVEAIANNEITDINIDDYNSVWFTIPASQGCENWKPIIIQGHTDMVSAGQTEDESLTNPIVPEIKGNLMHSKDHKTSLGADNGIGIGIILSLVRTRNDFQHGPIRCICTADEEIGLIGAEHISEDALKYNGNFIPYLLNEDNEEENSAYRSCSGNFLHRYYKNYAYLKNEEEEAFDNKFELSIDGLKGGHSGIDIVNNLANADRLIFEFLNELYTKSGAEIQLYEFNHEKVIEGQTVDVKWQTNQLIQNAHVIFFTNLTKDEVKNIFQQILNKWKSLYKDEKWSDFKYEISDFEDPKEKFNHFIHKDDTFKLIKFIGSNHNPKTTENGMYYGVFDKFEDGRPMASANVGPIFIKKNYQATIFECEDLVRSSVDDSSQYYVDTLAEKYISAATDAGVLGVKMSGYTPWVSPDQNPFIDLILEGYKQLGITAEIVDSLGGVEPAWFTSHNPNLLCSCIGPRIDGAHTQQETLHLDTIENCIKVTKYVISQMSKI